MSGHPVVFDVYGTLLRIEALRDRVAAYTDEPDRFVDAWRAKQIGYTWTASLMNAYRPFDDLTADALDYVAQALLVPLDDTARRTLLDGWLELAAYPDVPDVLETLRARGHRIAVFTNGVSSSARRALRHANVLESIDDVLTVEPARTFKPSPAAYRIVSGHYGLEPSAITFVSSNGWDVAGASAFGFRVLWCNRNNAPAERFGGRPAHVVRSLAELPAIVPPNW